MTPYEKPDQSDPFRIYTLQVNNIASPLGMEDPNPRLSWQLHSRFRGIQPAAAQIWVATSLQQLQHGDADVWLSGQIRGNDLFMHYSGSPLMGCTRYWWKVAVWTTAGQYSESEPTYWDTGLFAEDWQAEWIWRSNQVQVNDFAYFRKDIELQQTVTYAKLFISAHNVAQVYIDGMRIGGFGSPAPTLPAKRKLYLAYDVTSLLQPGIHCIAAIAHYLGGDGQNYVNALPGFRAQLEVLYSNGRRDCFKTDSTWETLKDMPHNTGTPFQQNRCISAIEDFDARKLDPAWKLIGFDKNQLNKAMRADIAMKEWPMRWQEIPEGAIEEVIIPTKIGSYVYTSDENTISCDNDYRQVFDNGKIISGWPRISLQGITGVTVRMRYSEDLDEYGFVKHNVSNETSEYYYDQYTMRGESVEEWQPDFSYKAFRYVEVTGYPYQILPEHNIEIVSSRTNISCNGSFQCSNSLLNDLYAACIQTQKNNILGQIVDCPHREQAQYLADSDLQAELLLYNFDAHQILEKVLCDFADAQLEDGTFPFVFPSNFENPEFNLQIPEWDLHYCTILWKMYLINGDKRLLERYFHTAKRMVDYYIGILDTRTGLVPIDKGWHISDWPYPTVDHNANYLTVQNVKLAQAIKIVADIAYLIKAWQDHKIYIQHLNSLAKNIIHWFYDDKHKRVRDCYGSEQMHQGVNAIALLYDLIPSMDREQVIAYVAAKPWECQTVLSLPLLRVLFENGHKELAYGLLNRAEYPGWGYMITQGAKTLWEGWDDIESHCHAWNGYPARILQEYIAGIQPTSPGFTDVLIKPFMPTDLTFAEAVVPTIRGFVSVRWERTIGNIQLAVHIPAAMNARLIVDLQGSASKVCIKETYETIWEHGQFKLGVSGIIQCEATSEGFEIELTSGTFDININSECG